MPQSSDQGKGRLGPGKEVGLAEFLIHSGVCMYVVMH